MRTALQDFEGVMGSKEKDGWIDSTGKHKNKRTGEKLGGLSISYRRDT